MPVLITIKFTASMLPPRHSMLHFVMPILVLFATMNTSAYYQKKEACSVSNKCIQTLYVKTDNDKCMQLEINLESNDCYNMFIVCVAGLSRSSCSRVAGRFHSVLLVTFRFACCLFTLDDRNYESEISVICNALLETFAIRCAASA